MSRKKFDNKGGYNMKAGSAICNPLCVKHGAIKPCPICDKAEFEKNIKEYFEKVIEGDLSSTAKSFGVHSKTETKVSSSTPEVANTYYDLIYADPPWKQTKGGLRKVRPKQFKNLDYKTLDLNDIEQIISWFNGKVLFLWTIDKYLFEAEEIMKNLGYKLHARLIWDKENGVAPAFTVRFSHEYLLWGYKSPMLPIAKNMRGKFTTVIREKATKHSKKPRKAYELIEALYPTQSRVELFARQKRVGWASWGDEI